MAIDRSRNAAGAGTPDRSRIPSLTAVSTEPHLEGLAAELSRRGCRTEVHGGTLVVSLGARGEWVIACDGRRFRWDEERGYVLGEVGAEPASAERAVLVLRQIARWA
ncbi:Uncharacterised protein [Mycobacterium tuberculosis]|nr:Uncharacterised protein [Mycobacterium tuberculosis]